MITDVFIEDGTLVHTQPLILDTHPSVWFEHGGQNNVPGHELAAPPFVATQVFTTNPANGGPGSSSYGINVGESLTLRFTMLSGVDVDQVNAAILNGLMNPLDVPHLRIAFHMQKEETGNKSDSFINGNVAEFGDKSSVPLPGVALAFMALLGGFGLTRRVAFHGRR